MKRKQSYPLGLLFLLTMLVISVSDGRPAALSSQESGVSHIDYLYPGEPPHWLGVVGPEPKWVDVPLPGDLITIEELRILTGGRAWTAQLCQSKSYPSTCSQLIPDSLTNGWSGDFTLQTDGVSYEDEDGGQEAHFLVESLAGDWMTFRVILKVSVE